MAREENLHIVIAESAPVLAAGLSTCLRRLPGITTDITEVKSPAALIDCVKAGTPDIILVNPSFGGVFNPANFQNEAGKSGFKIIAIEMGKLNPQTVALYDEVISVIDPIETIADKIRKLFSKDNRTEEKEALSQREKEIISLVVKGMTNQEIADKLFLSIHTVITHRRNIARKLEIHSATGLTIYAIVNHIVDLSEIKL